MPHYLRYAGLHRAPRKRVISLAAAGAVAAGAIVTGVIVSGTPGRASADTTAANIYVDNSAGSGCIDGSPDGVEPMPFCTIDAALAVAQPGQTVMVEQGIYPAVTISVSGTPGKPITIQGATTFYATIEPAGTASAFLVSGAHDVVISGFSVSGATAAPAYEVTGSSSDITINGGYVQGQGAATVPGVEVDAASDVTISRGSFFGEPGIQVNAGASGVDIAGNTINTASDHPGIVVTDAPGTDIAGNTVALDCGPGIEVAGGSPGAAIEDNVMSAGLAPQPQAPCATPGDVTAVSVSSGSTSGTVADYNLTSPSGDPALYDWGGTSYTTLASFTAATGQGAHDIVADPKLGPEQASFTLGYGQSVWYPPAGDSPAIDSANGSAPGELPMDELGNPRADDPDVANTGAGSGTGTSTTYFDRGAVELEGPTSHGVASLVPTGPLTVTASMPLTSAWPVNGPIGMYAYDFGDRYRVITTASSLQRTFLTAGPEAVGILAATGGEGADSSTAATIVGAGYTPVTPVRVLDTRKGTGTTAAGAIPAGGTLTLTLPSVAGIPAGLDNAVVMNVTVTQPTGAGYLTVYPWIYPGTGTPPKTSNLNFAKGQTLANQVTVKTTSGMVSFRNGSSGSVQVIADLAGVYGSGVGFQPQPPARVLDTRNGTGAARQAVAAGTRVRLSLSGKVPAGTTAVVLNVTVTQPRKGGYLSVYPDATGTPGTSSLNFLSGQTLANQVIVPLKGGIADFYNGSGGTVEVIADLDGYFGPSAKDLFVPYGPVRVDDTRADGRPVKALAPYSLPIAVDGTCAPTCPVPVAAVDNMTVTQPAKPGYLTLYPGGSSRPVASSLNFLSGQTVANLTTTQAGTGKTIDAYNGSPGTIELITDEFGYYIAPS